jgi:hypothetical protein
MDKAQDPIVAKAMGIDLESMDYKCGHVDGTISNINFLREIVGSLRNNNEFSLAQFLELLVIELEAKATIMQNEFIEELCKHGK